MKQTKILGWDKELVKSLVIHISTNKDKTLTQNFFDFSQKCHRQPFSVRNYFYKLCELIKKDKNVLKELNVDNVSNLFKHFSFDEEKELLKAILPIAGQSSVRVACKKLAEGDERLMTKYQNKYRNLIKNKKEMVEMIIGDLNEHGIETRNPYKIVKMPQGEVAIGEKDIQSLFRGIIKLALNKEIKQKGELLQKLEVVTKKLEETSAVLEKVESENQKLKQEFLTAQHNFQRSEQKTKSDLKLIKDLVDSEKMVELKNFFNRMQETKKSVFE